MHHLYVHVPFCKRRCSYCDFAIAVRREVPAGRFVTAIECEFGRRGKDVDRGHLTTLYFGGGTPSLLPPDCFSRLIRFFGDEMGFATDEPEITIEANPDDVSPSVVEAWLEAGINRVSVGVQSLNQQVLEWMHRPHTPLDGPQAVDTLRAAGMPSVSVDVIFGLPAGLHGDPVADVGRILESGPDHVSAYGLTVESHTPLSRWIDRGKVAEATDSDYADQFLRLDALLVGEGFEHYEISNYARPGRRSRHNEAYWTERPYLGLGPSAHSFSQGVRRWNLRDWAKYERRLSAGDDALDGHERLTAEQTRLERFFLGMRTSDGASMPEDGVLSAQALRSAEAQGWVRVADDRVRATPEGWLRLDALVTALTTSVEGG